MVPKSERGPAALKVSVGWAARLPECGRQFCVHLAGLREARVAGETMLALALPGKVSPEQTRR